MREEVPMVYMTLSRGSDNRRSVLAFRLVGIRDLRIMGIGKMTSARFVRACAVARVMK